MSLNNNLPGPILDILNRCRRKIRAFQHRDEAGQFQDTEELYRLSQEDLDRRPDDAYDPQEDYDMEFPEDEEADGSEAQRLHRKKIIGVAAGVAVVAVAAVIGNSIFPSSTNKNNTQKTGDQVAQVAPVKSPDRTAISSNSAIKKGIKLPANRRRDNLRTASMMSMEPRQPAHLRHDLPAQIIEKNMLTQRRLRQLLPHHRDRLQP